MRFWFAILLFSLITRLMALATSGRSTTWDLPGAR